MENSEIKLKYNKGYTALLGITSGIILIIGSFLLGSPTYIILFVPLGIYVIYTIIISLKAPTQSVVINRSGIKVSIGENIHDIPIDKVSAIRISEYKKLNNPLHSLLMMLAPTVVDTVIVFTLKNPELANSIDPKLSDATSLIINNKNSKIEPETDHLAIRIIAKKSPEIDKQLQSMFPSLYSPSYPANQ